MKATFQNFLLPQLGLATPTSLNLHQWISTNRFSSVELVNGRWLLRAYSEIELYQAFTPDFQRFSFSSFETFSVAKLERDHCDTTGWPFLKLYYSAFFAAHALTRSTGHGHINANSEISKAVNNYLSALGYDEAFTTGSYKVSIEEGDNGVVLILERSSEGSGVHDTFWKYFCNYLSELSNSAIEQSLPSASSFLRETNSLKNCILEKGSGGAWFSQIRNAINYRHEYDCWLPNTKKSPARQIAFSNQLGDPDAMELSLLERRDELARLVNLSSYLASMNHQVILQVLKETTGNSNFARSWRKLNASCIRT